ncbi:MAG: FAD synthase [Candidatus Diapherotrites archaeon]|nr:FAD synthase [Candidatus Diapherotrites archaeon]
MGKEKLVLAFGCFDILHPGHLYYLKKAKALGSKLIVVIARDENALKEKGYRPLKDEKQRLAIINALRFVDKAVLGSKRDKLEMILKYRPDVIALGYDHKVSKQTIKRFLKQHNIDAKVVRIKAYNAKKYKSSIIKKRIPLDLGIDEVFV